MKEDKGVSWKLLVVIFGIASLGFFAFVFRNSFGNIAGKIFTAIFTKDFIWMIGKGIIFFFAFVFFCHGPLVWAGILFSIEDGKGKLIYTIDRILTLKITYIGRCLEASGNVVEYRPSRLAKPFQWFRNYFFGSLHIKGIPGIHYVDKEKYEWERLNPMTGKSEKATSTKGEFPLKEFIPSINFDNLDVVGGQINVKIGPLIRITNPMKTATVARDWFPFLIDMIRGHVRECFAPLDFFRVMISKENFGQDEVKTASDLSTQIFEYFEGKIVNDVVGGKKECFPLIEFIERKYGIKIVKFYVMDPDPSESSKDLLNAIAKPEKARLEAKEMVIKATGDADSFNKKREAMVKPGGELLRKLEALEKSRLVTLGDGKGLNIFVDTKEGGTSGKP